MPIRTAPCDWPIVGDCDALVELADTPIDGGGEDGRTLADAVVEAATAYLWNWTGKAFGLCEVAVRPCRAGCDAVDWTTYLGWAGTTGPLLPSHGAPWTPALSGGRWLNLTCGRCGDGCSCDPVPSVRLPGPVDSVARITIDGADLEQGWRVDDHSLLVRTDGGTWPTCQDLAAPAGDPGTWEVVYRWGVPVPEGGRIAAGVLACEMAKALANDRSCGLPERITNQVTREGITVTILDQFEGLEAGRTGLWLVDSWVASIRATPARSSVHTPRRDPARVRRTTTYGG